MKKLSFLNRRAASSEKAAQADRFHENTIALKGGSYSLAVTVIVLAILIVVNVLVCTLPTSATNYDISSTKLYSITSNTKVVVNALQKDVTIYWIVQSGEEDSVIENLLGKYESLSEHIKVEKKNPDVYPTFAAQYTDESAANNSLVVECGDRSRFIGYDDIYLYQADMASYSYDTSFDGEGAITSAIDYVVNEDQPKMYVLEGHGEAQLPADVADQIEKENIETVSFSLLTEEAVPEEADCVLIYAPASDISAEEKKLLAKYAEGGGKLLVIAGPTEDGTLQNLYGLLGDYGVEAAEGIVVDTDREHFAFSAPYVLLPDIAESEITNPLLEEKHYILMPVSQGLTVAGASANADTVTDMDDDSYLDDDIYADADAYGDTSSDANLAFDSNVTALLTTSGISFSKADGYALSSYEKEEGDADGPFAVALSIACENDGQIIWFSSSDFLEETYNAYSSGANMDLAMNAVSSLIGEREAIAIRSKSLNYNYLTISDSAASLLKAVMIGIFPLVYIGVGICVVVRRRKQNEPA